MQPASPAHPLGTDELGRDLLSRVVWGARTSLVIGLVVLVIALAAGTLIGFAAGWWGGLEGLHEPARRPPLPAWR